MASDALKVAIFPTWKKPDRADGGIRRVVEAMEKYLPEFGIEVVVSSDDAEVICTHGTTYLDRPPDKPVVNVNHGLMWSRYDWPTWGHDANKLVVEAMARAQFHTAPSRWVANALRRGMMVYPEVVHHGIDAEEWLPAEDWQPYVLWNKARVDVVSDPGDMIKLAAMMPNTRFVSTIAGPAKPGNVEEIGIMPLQEMREFVRHAGIYLATARETFGIGTLEAMSSGVPVVGWDWGGQTEIIKHGETGFLAEPGDYEALAEGVKWALEERETLGANARQDVLERWGWERRIEQYANLFKRANEWWGDRPKVSVVVTTHNLARYLGDCLDSVASQDFEDWECVVVDDLSDDHPERVFGGRGKRFRLIKTGENLKLPGARNFGFEQTKGRYVIFLDADDMLAEHALLTLSDQLDKDPAIHVAYGHLDTVKEDGSDQKRSTWPFPQYVWRAQMAHLNQLPYSAMMRREVLERTGGFRNRHWRNEDAPFWIVASSYGFRIKKVTEASTLIYRWRSDSKTQGEPEEGDWTAWYPWRMGALNAIDGSKLMRQTAGNPNADYVPWSAQGEPPPGVRFWSVPDHYSPRVSVLIPVGPGHEKYVIDALESVRAQTFQDWECIVVNATGEKWKSGFDSPVQGCPWAKVVNARRHLRPSEARNLAASHAQADTIVMLDADDMLLPHALEEMYAHYIGTGGGLIYTDYLMQKTPPPDPLIPYETWDFRCGDVLKRMRHSMMCMIPKAKHEEIGGYDEAMPGWEDWDYLIALQAAGVCSYRLNFPSFVYRFRTGTIREDSFGKKDEILGLIRDKWSDYYERRKSMGCSGCPNKARANVSNSANPGNPTAAVSVSAVSGATAILAYQGPGDGKINIRGPITGQVYLFHRNEPKYVMAEDAEAFLGRTRKGKPDFVIVQQKEEARPVRVSMQIEGAPQKPEFPEMPGPDPRDVGGMTIVQLTEAVVDAGPDLLLQWLEEERAGKNRKGALRVLEAALDSELQPA